MLIISFYHVRYWLQTPIAGAYRFSVHGLTRRTNNNVESFHGRLKEKFQVSHPNLWTFLGKLKKYIINCIKCIEMIKPRLCEYKNSPVG